MLQYPSSFQPAPAPLRGQHSDHQLTATLGDVEFVILELLSQEALTGLEVLVSVQYLQRQLGGQFVFKKGELHPTLTALVAAGLVLKSNLRLPNGLERVYFHLTHAGRQALDKA